MVGTEGQCPSGVYSFSQAGKGECLVSRGVGVPSAVLENKVHVQHDSPCQLFPPGTGKPPKMLPWKTRCPQSIPEHLVSLHREGFSFFKKILLRLSMQTDQNARGR